MGVTTDTILIVERKPQLMAQFMEIHVKTHYNTLAGMEYTTLKQLTCGLLTTFSTDHFLIHQLQLKKLVSVLRLSK